jgi:opacity protein-like surface antigen
VGAGLGLTYVHEKKSFTSRNGVRAATRSATELGWQVILGVEQARPRGLFAEFWFASASTGGVEDVEGTSRSLANLQLRLGLRGRFK